MRKPFISDFALTQKFGERPDVYAQFGMSGHNGLDYGLPTGTEVLAPINGKVVETSIGMQGYGHYVKIESDTEGSLLAHLQDLSVSIGDKVTEGQLIGHSDNTGFSTGPHLHFGYYKMPRDRNNGYAGYIDQLPLLVPPVLPVPPTDQIGDKERAISVLENHLTTSTDQNNQPFGNLEGYANTLTQDAYRCWKNPPQANTPRQSAILAFLKSIGIS
jgi:murein DD-endopeptidase MepM/ murein hydrolase activator NlpD